MLTLSKALTSAQAKVYYQKDFSNGAGNYYSQRETVTGEWQGQLARENGTVFKKPSRFLLTLTVWKNLTKNIQQTNHDGFVSGFQAGGSCWLSTLNENTWVEIPVEC